jgi:hypothetical protein
MYMDRPLFMEPGSIMHPGMVLITTQDPGHGGSTLPILPISDGDSDGVIVQPGSVSDLVLDMDIMDMDTTVVDGGDLPVIIRHTGVDGMVAQGLMGFMEITFMCTTMFM